MYLNNAINQLDTYRTLTKDWKLDILFKCKWNILQKKPYAKYKTNKFKIIQVIQTMFSGHSGLKLETSNRIKPGKSPCIWK